ncbi:alpha-amylase [Vibrio coralliilyticus]|uniref:alpha-amylase n=1 Tax=Vibrio coralliilyticus TaxID=190893 RepID=UPI0015613FA1|nr:alpha-amylase [Vibrio coralliilyticus]NRF54261.1 alpha-amylase [Vibrio coralliilyticus]NRG02086.1 alpha-amylase [Vibrio coralliilyticus]
MKQTHVSLAVLTALISSASIAAPTLTISTTTTSRDFPLSVSDPLVLPLKKETYQVNISGIDGTCPSVTEQKVKFRKPLSLNCSSDTELSVKIRFSGDYSFAYDEGQNTITIARETKKVAAKKFTRPIPDVVCEQYKGGEVTLSLGGTFSDGTQLREAFSNQIVTVQNDQVRLTPSPNSGGLVLLEQADASASSAQFDYRNANIYFAMVDRFNNGDTSNDHSYGRKKDDKQEIGTFHGGDLKGLTEKLDYIQSLGTDVIWLSPIVEQVHGFVGGGEKGSFPFYSYHGYWTRDFTKIDQNFGNEEDLKQLVTQAHKRGMRIFLDAVVNHSGYSTLADLQFDNINVVNTENMPDKWQDWTPKSGQNWHNFNDSVDYASSNWQQWWGKDWVRAGLPGYSKPGSSDITMTLAGLPDFLTESDQHVTPPEWLLNNPGTRVQARESYTVSDYLIEWQTDWVKRFGIDGFRVDTVKHVEGDVWKRLKNEATNSLEQWRVNNNQTGQPFWMMGEVWGHSAYRSPYVDQGFDALINFDMQKKLDKGAACLSQMQETYQNYADSMQETPDFTPVSYMSSHDTELFFSRFNSIEMQRNAANALLLSPGAVQVYYGDEVGRDLGPYADDFHQGTRSDMLWELSKERQQLLKHWQTLGQFRQSHPAIGAGVHKEIGNNSAYVFSRSLEGDTVVVGFVGK